MADKTGNSGRSTPWDSRSAAYKDMTDLSREAVDQLIDKYSTIDRVNTTPSEKLEAAKILSKIASIYRAESVTSTSPEIAKQSIRIAKYLEARASELASKKGVNEFRLLKSDTVKDIALNVDEIDQTVASAVEDDVQKAADDIVIAAIGDKNSSDPVRNWKNFVQLQSGKIDNDTLKEIGEQYLNAKVDNPEKIANDAIRSSQAEYV
jgi:SepF-like predicted cell division protein (DUF552 family)